MPYRGTVQYGLSVEYESCNANQRVVPVRSGEIVLWRRLPEKTRTATVHKL